MHTKFNRTRFIYKPLVFLLCLVPFTWLLARAFTDNLGANPATEMIRSLGDWAIYLLLIGLAITPLRKLLNQPWLVSYRRMIGLFAFFYASMHFLSYIWFDQSFNFDEILRDIAKRPFITIGFINFLLLVPLAATSNKFMIKRLKQNWTRLHSAVYLVSVLALVHFYMMIKADYLRPQVLTVILLLLLGFRVWYRLRPEKRPIKRRPRASPAFARDRLKYSCSRGKAMPG